MIENKAFDLEQRAESPRAAAPVKRREVFLGSSAGGAHPTAASFNKDEPVMPYSTLCIPKVCMQTSDSERQHKVLGRDVGTRIDPSGPEF